MDSVKQEPEEISEITDSNLLELDGSVEETEDLNILEYQLLEELEQKDGSVDYLSFSCEYCGARFKQESHLRKHQFNESVKYKAGKKFKCFDRKCKRTFFCIQLRNEHVELHHPSSQPMIQPQIVKCSDCSFVAKNSHGLKSHSVIHKPMHRCDQCSHSFETWTLLISHKDSHHKHACSKCGFQFETRKDFREHQSQMGNFKCLLCEEEFKCEYARSQHLERDHEKDHREQLATLQNKESSKLENFDFEIKFECDHCGHSFDKRLKLITHMIDHTTKHICSCDECGSIFTSLKRLTMHRRKYSGNFMCMKKNCYKKFKCKRALNIHKGKDHVEIWKCPECLKVFKTKKTLRNHHNEQHNTKFQCDLCELSFFRKKMLLIHKWKSHEKEIDISQYSCDECGKIFRTRGGLLKHKVLTEHQIFQSPIVNENSSGSFVDPKQEHKKFSAVTETLTFEGHMDELAGYSIKKEPEYSIPDIEIHSMATSNQQEMSSKTNQRLETVVKHEQEGSPLVTDTLSINIHVKEEPEVSYVLKFSPEEEEL